MKNRLFIDEIRKGTLLHFIQQERGRSARFRYEGDGLRFVTDEDTVINDWTPKQVEEALRGLEASGRVRVSYRPHATHTSEDHVSADPLRSVDHGGLKPREQNQSFDEVITLIKTDDEFCTDLVLDIYDLGMVDFYCGYGFRLKELPDSQIFNDMGRDLTLQNGITRRQLALCRMPDSNGIPRLARYNRQVDEQHEIAHQITFLFDLQGLIQAGLSPIEFIEINGRLWLLENGLPSETLSWTPVATLETLEQAENVTVRRDSHRITVTGVFLTEDQEADFQNVRFRYTLESGKIGKVFKCDPY